MQPPFPTGAMFAPPPTFARGALPTPRHRLAAAMPHRIVGATPAMYVRVPKRLSMWNNDVHGCCVTTEEAFNQACNGVFISDAVVKTWATNHGVLEGAYLDQVLDWMVTGGFPQDGNTYDDGGKLSVDYTNDTALRNAIAAGPVKIGVAANQIQATPGVGQRIGWVATGYRSDQHLDHCTSLAGYGPIAWLAQQLSLAYGLNVTVPAGVDGSKPGYIMFTWSTVGIIDVPSMLAITGEAWLRNPNTRQVGTNPPTAVEVYTSSPVTPPPPPPPNVPGASLIALSPTTQPGQSDTLQWSVTNATAADINGVPLPVTSPAFQSGTQTVTPTATTAYVLSASNAAGTAHATATVTVGQVPPPSPPPPAILQAQTFNTAVRKGARFWDIAQVNIPVGSTLVIYAPGPHSIEGVFAEMTTLSQQISNLQTSTDKGFASVLAAIGVDLTPQSPRGMRSTVLGVPGGNVIPTFTWNPQPPGDTAVGFNLQINNPDGTPFAPSVSLGLVTTYTAPAMPDSTATYTMVLTAVGPGGTSSPPATLPFVPHTEPPPVPPAMPTGLAVTIADAPVVPPPAPPQASPVHAAGLMGMTPAQWAAFVAAIAAEVAKLLGGGQPVNATPY